MGILYCTITMACRAASSKQRQIKAKGGEGVGKVRRCEGGAESDDGVFRIRCRAVGVGVFKVETPYEGREGHAFSLRERQNHTQLQQQQPAEC